MRFVDFIFKSLFLEMEKVFVREGGREREFYIKFFILKKKFWKIDMVMRRESRNGFFVV